MSNDATTKPTIETLLERINEIGAKLEAQITSLRSEMNTEITSLRSEMNTQITSLRSEMNTQLQTINSNIRLTNQKLDVVAKELLEIKARQGDLESRIETLEKQPA